MGSVLSSLGQKASGLSVASLGELRSIEPSYERRQRAAASSATLSGGKASKSSSGGFGQTGTGVGRAKLAAASLTSVRSADAPPVPHRSGARGQPRTVVKCAAEPASISAAPPHRASLAELSTNGATYDESRLAAEGKSGNTNSSSSSSSKASETALSVSRKRPAAQQRLESSSRRVLLMRESSSAAGGGGGRCAQSASRPLLVRQAKMQISANNSDDTDGAYDDEPAPPAVIVTAPATAAAAAASAARRISHPSVRTAPAPQIRVTDNKEAESRLQLHRHDFRESRKRTGTNTSSASSNSTDSGIKTVDNPKRTDSKGSVEYFELVETRERQRKRQEHLTRQRKAAASEQQQQQQLVEQQAAGGVKRNSNGNINIGPPKSSKQSAPPLAPPPGLSVRAGNLSCANNSGRLLAQQQAAAPETGALAPASSRRPLVCRPERVVEMSSDAADQRQQRATVSSGGSSGTASLAKAIAAAAQQQQVADAISEQCQGRQRRPESAAHNVELQQQQQQRADVTPCGGRRRGSSSRVLCSASRADEHDEHDDERRRHKEQQTRCFNDDNTNNNSAATNGDEFEARRRVQQQASATVPAAIAAATWTTAARLSLGSLHSGLSSPPTTAIAGPPPPPSFSTSTSSSSSSSSAFSASAASTCSYPSHSPSPSASASSVYSPSDKRLSPTDFQQERASADNNNNNNNNNATNASNASNANNENSLLLTLNYNVNKERPLSGGHGHSQQIIRDQSSSLKLITDTSKQLIESFIENCQISRQNSDQIQLYHNSSIANNSNSFIAPHAKDQLIDLNQLQQIQQLQLQYQHQQVVVERIASDTGIKSESDYFNSSTIRDNLTTHCSLLDQVHEAATLLSRTRQASFSSSSFSSNSSSCYPPLQDSAEMTVLIKPTSTSSTSKATTSLSTGGHHSSSSSSASSCSSGFSSSSPSVSLLQLSRQATSELSDGAQHSVPTNTATAGTSSALPATKNKRALVKASKRHQSRRQAGAFAGTKFGGSLQDDQHSTTSALSSCSSPALGPAPASPSTSSPSCSIYDELLQPKRPPLHPSVCALMLATGGLPRTQQHQHPNQSHQVYYHHQDHNLVCQQELQQQQQQQPVDDRKLSPMDAGHKKGHSRHSPRSRRNNKQKKAKQGQAKAATAQAEAAADAATATASGELGVNSVQAQLAWLASLPISRALHTPPPTPMYAQNPLIQDSTYFESPLTRPCPSPLNLAELAGSDSADHYRSQHQHSTSKRSNSIKLIVEPPPRPWLKLSKRSSLGSNELLLSPTRARNNGGKKHATIGRHHSMGEVMTPPPETRDDDDLAASVDCGSVGGAMLTTSRLDDRDEFTTLSYNVLSDRLVKTERYPASPDIALNWSYRRELILRELLEFSPDVIALQELEMGQFCDFFEPKLAEANYVGLFESKSRARTMEMQMRKRVDGCAIFYKRHRFTLAGRHLLEFNQIAMANARGSEAMLNRVMTKDNIGLVAVLELIDSPPASSSMSSLCDLSAGGDSQAKTSQTKRPQLQHAPSSVDKDYYNGDNNNNNNNSSTNSTGGRQRPRRLIFCNTHIYWDPEYSDVKLIQTIMLMNELKCIERHYAQQQQQEPGAIGAPPAQAGAQLPPTLTGTHCEPSDQPAQVPLVLLGDFNSLPVSGVTNYLLDGRIDSSHADFKSFKYTNCTNSLAARSLGSSSAGSDQYQRAAPVVAPVVRRPAFMRTADQLASPGPTSGQQPTRAAAAAEGATVRHQLAPYPPLAGQTDPPTQSAQPHGNSPGAGVAAKAGPGARLASGSSSPHQPPASISPASSANLSSPCASSCYYGSATGSPGAASSPSSCPSSSSSPYSLVANASTIQVDEQLLTYEHPFNLRSAYKLGTMPFTNYTTNFKATIDYIFYSHDSLKPIGLLGPLDSRWLRGNKIKGFPQIHFPSDHLPLLVKFKIAPQPAATGQGHQYQHQHQYHHHNHHQLTPRSSSSTSSSSSASSSPATYMTTTAKARAGPTAHELSAGQLTVSPPASVSGSCPSPPPPSPPPPLMAAKARKRRQYSRAELTLINEGNKAIKSGETSRLTTRSRSKR